MEENVFEKKETLFKQKINSLSHLIFKKVQNITFSNGLFQKQTILLTK